MIRKLLKDECGYSLVEVMASIMILTIAILPMVGMFDMGLNTATTGSNYDKARMLANANLEKVLSLRYSDAVSEENYLPVNASPTAGTSVPCDESMLSATEQVVFDCEVETTYVDSDLDEDSTSINRMRVEVTAGWDDTGSFTTTGLTAR